MDLHVLLVQCFHHHSKNLLPAVSCTSHFLFPSALSSHSSTFCPYEFTVFWEAAKKKKKTPLNYVDFCARVPLLSMFLKFIYGVACISTFFLWLHIILLYRQMYFTYPTQWTHEYSNFVTINYTVNIINVHEQEFCGHIFNSLGFVRSRTVESYTVLYSISLVCVDQFPTNIQNTVKNTESIS